MRMVAHEADSAGRWRSRLMRVLGSVIAVGAIGAPTGRAHASWSPLDAADPETSTPSTSAVVKVATSGAATNGGMLSLGSTFFGNETTTTASAARMEVNGLQSAASISAWHLRAGGAPPGR